MRNLLIIGIWAIVIVGSFNLYFTVQNPERIRAAIEDRESRARIDADRLREYRAHLERMESAKSPEEKAAEIQAKATRAAASEVKGTIYKGVILNALLR